MFKDIINDRIGSMIFATGVLIRGYSSQTFSEKNFGITPEQYLILLLIIENKGIHQRHIAEITLKDRGNVARIVEILLKKELIEKVPDSNGRRILKITATKKGEQLCELINPTAKYLRSEITKNISKDELDITLNTLQKIRNNTRDKVRLQI